MLFWCIVASVVVLALVGLAWTGIIRRGLRTGSVRRVDMDSFRRADGSASGNEKLTAHARDER
jgi:hypothetical protein